MKGKSFHDNVALSPWPGWPEGPTPRKAPHSSAQTTTNHGIARTQHGIKPSFTVSTRPNLGTERKEIETLESVGDSSGLPFALQTLSLNIESSQERGKDFGSEEADHQCKSAGGRSVSGCDVS